MTSNQALQRAKYLFYAAKAGHTGSLDPLATGVLPVCFGEATKFSQFLLDSDKGYRSTFRFGMTTASGDADGEITGEQDASDLTEAQVEAALEQFRGDILQVPSMYSALKKDGQPLYKLAREGIEVEREARPVTIYEYRLLAFRPGPAAEADVEIRCSKGTYVRTLAEDLGQALGVGAHVVKLHRHLVAGFSEDDATDLAELETLREGCRGEDLDYLLKPIDTAVSHLMEVDLDDSVAWYLRRGQPVVATEAYRQAEEGDIVRIFENGTRFIGVGEVLEDGMLAPRRLVSEPQA
jgi:tRNA pseudouridine55 synthase